MQEAAPRPAERGQSVKIDLLMMRWARTVEIVEQAAQVNLLRIDGHLQEARGARRCRMETRQRRSFTDDYKRQAVDPVASSGRSIGSVAKELGLRDSVLRRWVELRGAGREPTRRRVGRCEPRISGGYGFAGTSQSTQ
jgi:hypothetical protein